MIDDTPEAFDDRAAFGSFLGDLFKASPAGHLQRQVGQQVANKIVAQGGSPFAAKQIADLGAHATPSAGDLAKGLAKTTAIAAPALIAVAAPVAVPAIASALGYAAPTAAETGIAALAATSAVAKPALSILRDTRGMIDNSGLRSAVPSSATGAIRAGSQALSGSKTTPPKTASSAAGGGGDPASTANRAALMNLLAGIAYQVPGSPPAPAALTAPATNPGLLHQTGFAPVLGVAPGAGKVRVARSKPSVATTIAKSIDVKGLPASITNAVLWTVTAAGQIARGQTVIASSLPQWLIYSSHKVVKVG